jgi:eukaryotic-like serine/threonine-protein kinase
VVAPSSKDLLPGVAFGGYVVRELIGRGGMATVYRAEHLLLNKPVALKVMDQALVPSAAARQRFLLEGRAASAIKHPNVVDVTDVGVHDGLPYLVMELLKGEDLETHLRKRTILDEASTIRLALPIMAALYTAHCSGVVHRDIKPSNIFMSIGPDEQVVPKVLDFGISKVSFDNPRVELTRTPQHQLIGTPRYLPPEALHGARELGPLSDQYSLGVVLYQCVTGCTPFSGDTLVSLLNSLSRGAFEPPRQIQPSVSPGLDRVITRALSPEPSDRFPTLRDMGRAMIELAAERTQVVWGHSFRTPEAMALWRASDPWTPRVDLPPPSTERLATNELPMQRRWRSIALGLGLVLVGVLGSALWSSVSSFRPTPGASSSRRAESGVAPAAMAVLPQPVDSESDTRVVLGLTARPRDEKPASAEVAPLRVRPTPAPARRPAAAPLRRSERAKTEGRPVIASAVPSVTREPVPATPLVAPAAPLPEPARATPSEPPSSPRRLGANHSPLLD